MLHYRLPHKVGRPLICVPWRGEPHNLNKWVMTLGLINQPQLSKIQSKRVCERQTEHKGRRERERERELMIMMMALSSLCPSPASPLFLNSPHLIHRKRCSVIFSTDPPPSVTLPFFTIPCLLRNKALLCRAGERVEPLDLTEENVERVLLDARSEVCVSFILHLYQSCHMSIPFH